MADILIVKDSNTLIPKIGISEQERLNWMKSFAIYDITAAGGKAGPYGPLNPQRKTVPVSVEVGDDGLPIRSVIAGGITAAYASRINSGDRPVIAAFGDSFLGRGWYSWLAPWGRVESTTLPGITFAGMERNVTNAAHTLSYNASRRTCTFDGGPETPLVNGFQIIPGASAKTGCAILVRLAALGSSNGSLTCTRTGTRPDEIVYGNSALWWFGFLSYQGYIVKNYAHSGGWAADGASVISRADDFDGFILNYHTNDITGGATLAQLQASTIANLDAAYAKSRSKTGIINGCCTYRTGWSTAQAEIADAFNRWLPDVLKSYPGVVARFPWARLVSAAGNSGNTALMNGDNIHPDDPGQLLAGKDWADFFSIALPGMPWDFGSALGVYSATNPTGNMLLNPNPVGDVSGVPTGWSPVTQGANGTVTASKVARTDGVAGEWARLTGSATADNVQHFHTLPDAMFAAKPANGSTVQLFIEARLSGALQMAPVVLMSEAKAASLVAYSRLNNDAAKALPLPNEITGVIALAPYLWSDTAGAATIDVRVGQRLLNGASGAVMDTGRMYLGTPSEFSMY